MRHEGGGEGMGAIEKTLEALDDRVGGACQVVAICGRNKALIERLSNRSALPRTDPACSHTVSTSCILLTALHCRSFKGGLRVKVCGFVTNMAEWMTACDTIITKAGPGTIAEALICGLPIILNGFIPCQVRAAFMFGLSGGIHHVAALPLITAQKELVWHSYAGRRQCTIRCG